MKTNETISRRSTLDRRSVLKVGASAIAAAPAAALAAAQERPPASAPATSAIAQPAGTPPAFGTAPPVGPEVSSGTFAEAEKLVNVPMTEKDRAQAASNWRKSMAALVEHRAGPRKVTI